MSVAQQIQRIEADRDKLRGKLVNMGLVLSNANLDEIADEVDKMTVIENESVEIKEGESYTIEQGFHKGGTVTGVPGGGNYKLQSKTVTPTKSEQTIASDADFYGLSSVVVNPIPQNYADVSNVSASAGDVLVNKSFVNANGVSTAGTMPNNGKVTKALDTSTTSFVIPAGYHDGQGSISISLETKEVTPTKENQTIVPTTGKLLSSVTVKAITDEYIDTSDSTAKAGNVLAGEVAYGYDTATNKAVKLTGTMPNNGALSGEIDATNLTYTIPAGYTSGGSVVVTGEEKSATPTKSVQNITPSEGKLLTKVTVAAIPAAYQDVTGVTAVAANVLSGAKFVASDGTLVTGTMANNGAVSGTITGLGAVTGDTSFTIPAGYTTGGTVSLTSDIENQLSLI